jgi:hypothetical protein
VSKPGWRLPSEGAETAAAAQAAATAAAFIDAMINDALADYALLDALLNNCAGADRAGVDNAVLDALLDDCAGVDALIDDAGLRHGRNRGRRSRPAAHHRGDFVVGLHFVFGNVQTFELVLELGHPHFEGFLILFLVSHGSVPLCRWLLPCKQMNVRCSPDFNLESIDFANARAGATTGRPSDH